MGIKRKIDCLNRLFELTKCRTEVLQYLKSEKIITDDVMAGILHGNHNTHSTQIATLLQECAKKETVQLVDYEWTILPKELIRLTIVTANSKKEFLYTV